MDDCIIVNSPVANIYKTHTFKSELIELLRVAGWVSFKYHTYDTHP